jgi:hypothetical protein
VALGGCLVGEDDLRGECSACGQQIAGPGANPERTPEI